MVIFNFRKDSHNFHKNTSLIVFEYRYLREGFTKFHPKPPYHTF